MKALAWVALLGALGICRVAGAGVTIRQSGDSCSIAWRGDEAIDITVSRTKGILWSPIGVRVGERRVSFDGFSAVFNGEQTGYSVRLVNTQCGKDRIEIDHVLDNPHLPAPARVRISLWMTAEDKALRAQVSYSEDKFHLDRLGLGNHHGLGLEAQRMFLGRMLVMDGPLTAFDVKHNYNLTRYWCFTMANGLSEMQGTDVAPRGFAFDPATGRYDLYTYCDSPITYTFVFTEMGAQEAIQQYRRTLHTPAPTTLSQLPGRVVIMTAYPIRQRYEDFLEELTGRGVRDFIWLSYKPAPGDHAVVEPYGALYAVYDMYTDLFAEGPRKAEGWSPELVLFTRPGQMMRGYWNSTRALPNRYIELAKARVQGTLGIKFENRGFLPGPETRYSNLTITKQEIRPTALYLDVHSSKTPFHYYDYQGRHYPARDYLKYEKELFDFAREYLGNVPILSEGNGEAFAGIMDGGIFMDWPTPATLKIQCRDWGYYPFIDQVHRERLLSVGFHAPLDGPDPEQINLAALFGRQQVINAYYGSPQTDVGRRAQVYYLTSAFHRMLGRSVMKRIEFADDDIHRPVVAYSNGAMVWANRGKRDWEVNGHRLPPRGYLIQGPGGFEQYRSRLADQEVEMVESPGYQYFCAGKPVDFGPVVTNGALVLLRPAQDRLMVYEVLKPHGEVRVRVPDDRKIARAWALLTRGRRVELHFPDFRQDSNALRFTPVEMATAVGYEFQFESMVH